MLPLGKTTPETFQTQTTNFWIPAVSFFMGCSGTLCIFCQIASIRPRHNKSNIYIYIYIMRYQTRWPGSCFHWKMAVVYYVQFWGSSFCYVYTPQVGGMIEIRWNKKHYLWWQTGVIAFDISAWMLPSISKPAVPFRDCPGVRHVASTDAVTTASEKQKELLLLSLILAVS